MPGGLNRSITVDGLVNARDLGGLLRCDGSYTPRDVFFRSDNIDLITGRGWEQLRTLGVRTVLDLRQPGEREQDATSRPSWLTTRAVDLDGLDNTAFWQAYWDNGLMATALYYLPHLAAMPERAGAALTALVTAPPGGVLFHCMSGRDRTGLIALLLLAGIGTTAEAIVDDHLESIRRDTSPSAGQRNQAEDAAERICRDHGTTTEGAFRQALCGLDMDAFMDAAGLTNEVRALLRTWRGSVVL